MAGRMPTNLATLRVIALAVLAGLVPAQPPADKPPQPAPPKQVSATPELAVIVNTANPTTGLTFAELRAHCKLEVQFWGNNQRTQLFLRPSDSTEMKILLDRVYGMTPGELHKYWVGRVFRGEIPSRPTAAPTAAAALARVRANEGAFSVVLASEVGEGVRVLAIDGKLPGDAGYALRAREARPSPPTDGGAGRDSE